MQKPLFTANEYLNAAVMNTAASDYQVSLEDIGSLLHTPGVLNPSGLVFSFNNTLTVGVTIPNSFGILFSDGTIAHGLGTTAGTTSNSYSVDFSSIVPSTGSVTAYLAAEITTIGQNPYSIVGPPIGHPDYSASYLPQTAYATSQYSLNLYATTTVPNNQTSFSLGQLSLSAGQTGITSLTYNWHYSGSLLDPTGVTAGTYTTPLSFTVSDDGRITNVVSGAVATPAPQSKYGVNQVQVTLTPNVDVYFTATAIVTNSAGVTNGDGTNWLSGTGITITSNTVSNSGGSLTTAGATAVGSIAKGTPATITGTLDGSISMSIIFTQK